MPQLLLHTQDQQTRAIRLDGRRARLGRSEECEIAIDDVGVSRSHAVIFKAGADFVIEDLGSRNGTFVNDQRVERSRLSDGDRIRLSPTVELEFRMEDPGGARSGGDRTGRVFRRVSYSLLPRGAGTGARPIRIHSGVTTVGRQGAALLELEDSSVSRLHARLDLEGSNLFVTDLKSSNGTRVNGETVVRARLGNDDVVQFGNIAFAVRVTRPIAWDRIGKTVGGVLLLSAAVGGVLWGSRHWSDWESSRREEARVRKQAITSISKGIASYRAGEAYWQGYFSYAADLLILAEIAPADARPGELDKIFRPIIPDLPAADRGFDFAKTSVLSQKQAADEERLPNREYVELQCKRLALSLGQSEDVPPGFVDQVWRVVAQTSTYPHTFQNILYRSRRLNARICELLREKRIPEVFCYVAWVESSLDPMTTSPAGARGLWQFMPATAREYGLSVGPDIDQRTDVTRSTQAAASKIGNLILKFGREQFMCALASYNRGEGAVWYAMGKIPDPMMESSKKFWYLVDRNLLPQETSEYVPKIFAYKILAGAPERFGLKLP